MILLFPFCFKQDKPAFIFCVEDRALFCQDCDEPIHSAGSLSANHQRFLATGIRVALSSSGCNKGNEKSRLEPPNRNSEQISVKTPAHGQQVPGFGSSWSVDDLLEFTDFESSEKVRSIYCIFILLPFLIYYPLGELKQILDHLKR